MSKLGSNFVAFLEYMIFMCQARWSILGRLSQQTFAEKWLAYLSTLFLQKSGLFYHLF